MKHGSDEDGEQGRGEDTPLSDSDGNPKRLGFTPHCRVQRLTRCSAAVGMRTCLHGVPVRVKYTQDRDRMFPAVDRMEMPR